MLNGHSMLRLLCLRNNYRFMVHDLDLVKRRIRAAAATGNVWRRRQPDL